MDTSESRDSAVKQEVEDSPPRVVARVHKKLLGLHGLAGSPEKGLDVVRVESAVVVVTDGAYLVAVESTTGDGAVEAPVNVKAEHCRDLIRASKTDTILLESAPGITIGDEAIFPNWRPIMKKFPTSGGFFFDARRLASVLKAISNLYPKGSPAPVWICLPKDKRKPTAIKGVTQGWRARAVLMPMDLDEEKTASMKILAAMMAVAPTP